MPHKVPLSVNEIKEEILWNDRYIKIGGKTVFCIKDILNAYDNFLSFQDFKDTFDVRCSFRPSLRSVVPKGVEERREEEVRARNSLDEFEVTRL